MNTPNQRAESLFHAFAMRLAERLVHNSANREADYYNWVSVIYAIAGATFGGERIYAPQSNRLQRDQARARIEQALDAGQPAAEVAKREGVHRETVHRIRRQRGTFRP